MGSFNQFDFIVIIQMGNKTSLGLPTVIAKNWEPIEGHSDVFRSKLTSEYVREHTVQVDDNRKIQDYKARMKQSNPSICRVAFYFADVHGLYYVYTDENRNKVTAQSVDEWKNIKNTIIEAFVLLARRYGPTNVCEQMIGADYNNQIKVWIHPDALCRELWSPCSTEAEMIGDILTVCKKMEERWLRFRRNSTQVLENQASPSKTQTRRKDSFFNSQTPKSKKVQEMTKNMAATGGFPSKNTHLPYFLRSKQNQLKSSQNSNGSSTNQITKSCPGQKDCENLSKKKACIDFINQQQQYDFTWTRSKTCQLDDQSLAQNIMRVNKKFPASQKDQRTKPKNQSVFKDENTLETNDLPKNKLFVPENNFKSLKIPNNQNKFSTINSSLRPSDKKHFLKFKAEAKRSSFSNERPSNRNSSDKNNIGSASIEKKALPARQVPELPEAQTKALFMLKKVEYEEPKNVKKLDKLIYLGMRDELESQIKCFQTLNNSEIDIKQDMEFLEFFDESELREYERVQQKIGIRNQQYKNFKKQVARLLSDQF